MKRFLAAALFAAAAALPNAATHAQQTTQAATGAPQTLELTLDRALEIALSENPTIKTAEMEIARYDYVRRETLGNHLPTVSVGGQYTFNLVKQEMAKGMSFGADMSAAVTGDVSVPLVVPAVYATLRLNRTQQALAVEQARASRIDLASAVKKSFFQILLLERSLEVLRESERTISATVENTREMHAAGLASEYDLLTAEVQLSNLAPSIITTTNGVATARQMLKMYLSVPEGVDIVLSGSLDDHAGSAPVVPHPDGAVDDNSELRQLEYQQTLLSQQIRLANAARLPVLAAYGSTVFTGQDKTTGFGMGPDGGMAIVELPKWWWQKPTSAGFQLSIPIFSGGRNTAKVKQLRNSVSQLDLQKDYLRRAKELEARTAAANLVSAYGTIVANRRTVAQAEKAYSIARTRFDAGAGTMLEVNQAQLNVTQSRLNLSQATYDMLAAGADYDRVVGKIEN